VQFGGSGEHKNHRNHERDSQCSSAKLVQGLTDPWRGSGGEVPRLVGAGRWSAAGPPVDRAPLPPDDPVAPSRAASAPPPATARRHPRRGSRREGSP
jgi:hypothetical protein